MKLIVIGATGTIGKAVADALAARHEVIRASRNGEVGVDVEDAASVAALGEHAEILTRVLGKPVRFVDIPPEAEKDQLLKSGMPGPIVDSIFRMMTETREGKGKYAIVSPDLHNVLGRSARTYEDWVRAHVDAFR
jgi:uncharacterized protein YbjT (DUF2867 family)